MRVMGFQTIPRPRAFENSFNGAWLCGMGLELCVIPSLLFFSCLPILVVALCVSNLKGLLLFFFSHVQVVSNNFG